MEAWKQSISVSKYTFILQFYIYQQYFLFVYKLFQLKLRFSYFFVLFTSSWNYTEIAKQNYKLRACILQSTNSNTIQAIHKPILATYSFEFLVNGVIWFVNQVTLIQTFWTFYFLHLTSGHLFISFRINSDKPFGNFAEKTTPGKRELNWNSSLKMILLLQHQGFVMHRRENKTNTIKPLGISSAVSTRVRFIKKVRTLERLKSYILYCKYFGRLKISDHFFVRN